MSVVTNPFAPAAEPRREPSYRGSHSVRIARFKDGALREAREKGLEGIEEGWRGLKGAETARDAPIFRLPGIRRAI
jgi:hypothetical protein